MWLLVTFYLLDAEQIRQALTCMQVKSANDRHASKVHPSVSQQGESFCHRIKTQLQIHQSWRGDQPTSNLRLHNPSFLFFMGIFSELLETLIPQAFELVFGDAENSFSYCPLSSSPLLRSPVPCLSAQRNCLTTVCQSVIPTACHACQFVVW